MFFMLQCELTLHDDNRNKPNTKGLILQDLV